MCIRGVKKSKGLNLGTLSRRRFSAPSDQSIYGEWSRTTQHKGGEAGEIEEATFIAHRAELRAGGSHGYELDRANP